MNRQSVRYVFMPILLAISGGASAVGFGELRGIPVLGEPLRFEVNLLGLDKATLDPSCFRVVQPTGQDDDIPWLKKAAFSVRKGTPPILEVRSHLPLRDPILQVALSVGCGHAVSRTYVLMASPLLSEKPPIRESETQSAQLNPLPHTVRQQDRVRPVVESMIEPVKKLAPVKKSRKTPANLREERIVIPSTLFVGEPFLRLATELTSGREVQESQREVLRLEYRLLMAMHEQAITQIAAAEKLRNLEGTLSQLQQQASDFAQRVEKDGQAPAGHAANTGAQTIPSGASAPLPQQPAAKAPPVTESESALLSGWGLYGVLLGAALGLAGWLGWRHRRSKILADDENEGSIEIPEVKVDPKRLDERDELGGVDLPFEPATMGMPMQVDVALDTVESVSGSALPTVQYAGPQADSVMSISATTLDEHFEANPVMELADIMLSFGRVKGAAQALQEYIDNNPQEALQPWIRLLDVYRMAGMRDEFESVARNLNQNFNVAVQSWEDRSGLAILGEQGGVPTAPVAPLPQSLEDLPRLMNTVLQLWATGDVVGYLYQLLRDNRGGQRQGFAMPVVEDILFLIELKETANRMG